ncbi:MAG: Gfo/Idh/MocA family protein, partial [Anaerolineales bacterium]
MTTTIRWGILSTASIARRRVVPALQSSRNGEVVAVASRDADRARAFAAEQDIPRSYGSYEALLGDPNIDAIYIGLPNNLHAEWAMHCAAAGKPTLCEKPLALDAKQAQQMVDAFATRGVPFAEAFMYRFHPQTRRVLELVAEGVLGDLHAINAVFSFRLPPEAAENIRLQASLGGGSLMDVGCYCVNLMRLATGAEPEAVTAQALIGKTSGVDERFTGTLRFPGGVLG